LTPEAEGYLRHGKISPATAKKALTAEVFTLAAREAYIAALNAARAIVFERMTIASKTHAGTRSLLHQLVRDGLNIDRRTLDVLADGFDVKTHADYGPHKEVAKDEAEDMVRRAEALVSLIETELAN
jgi:uncharacterized protein (UPF0332 family)